MQQGAQLRTGAHLYRNKESGAKLPCWREKRLSHGVTECLNIHYALTQIHTEVLLQSCAQKKGEEVTGPLLLVAVDRVCLCAFV